MTDTPNTETGSLEPLITDAQLIRAIKKNLDETVGLINLAKTRGIEVLFGIFPDAENKVMRIGTFTAKKDVVY